VIKFVCDLQHLGGFFPVTLVLVSSNNKTDCHDIAEILLKVALGEVQYTPSVSTMILSGPTYSSQNVRQI
jgi:hypothetical protein